MSTNEPSSKDSHNRMIILEKLIELKSNECAYYRSKVHLMQMSSFPSPSKKTSSIKHERSSSEETNPSQSDSVDSKQRRSSVPLFSQPKSILKKKSLDVPFGRSRKSKYVPSTTQRRRSDQIYAHNQNHYEDDHKPTTNSTSPLLTIDKHLLDQLFISYVNKHLQPEIANDKTIQCNDRDFQPIKVSPKASSTVLMIRLPRRFVKSLVEQQKNPTSPKLKVHLSSELLNRLFQSIDLNSLTATKTPHPANQFTIQSQFGQIAACVSHEDTIEVQEPKTVHAKAEVTSHHRERLPTVRHLAHTRSDGSERNKLVAERHHLSTASQKHRHYRRKKRHLHKSNRTSDEEISSKRSSLTNVTQSDESPPTNSSLSIKKNKRN